MYKKTFHSAAASFTLEISQQMKPIEVQTIALRTVNHPPVAHPWLPAVLQEKHTEYRTHTTCVCLHIKYLLYTLDSFFTAVVTKNVQFNMKGIDCVGELKRA